jgi:hypothetical protein
MNTNDPTFIEVRELLIKHRQSLICYSRLALLVTTFRFTDGFDKRLWKLLGEISRYEHSQGRPLLSAIVTHKNEPNDCGPGFWDVVEETGLFDGVDDLAFWLAEVTKIQAYKY